MYMDKLGSLRINTERLTIRRFTAHDADAWFSIYSNPDTCDALGGISVLVERNGKFDRTIHNLTVSPMHFTIALQQTGEAIGFLCLTPELDSRAVPCISLSICIHHDHRRQGYAHEAIKALLPVLHNDLAYALVLASVFDYNESTHNLLQKLGFTLEGKTHWRANHPARGLVDAAHYCHG